MSPAEALIGRVVEGAPLLVAFLSVALYMVWKTWRVEREDFLEAQEKDRETRAAEHREVIAAIDRSTAATNQMREQMGDIRRLLGSR